MACNCTGACRRPPYQCGGAFPVQQPFNPWPSRQPEPWGLPNGPAPYPYTTPNSFPGLTVPVGCICPAGSNKDCERSDCPRKPLPGSSGMSTPPFIRLGRGKANG